MCICVFGRTSLSKVDWIRHSSACNGIVITYATLARCTRAHECVCERLSTSKYECVYDERRPAAAVIAVAAQTNPIRCFGKQYTYYYIVVDIIRYSSAEQIVATFV